MVEKPFGLVMDFVMMQITLKNATMMVVIVVALMFTKTFVSTAPALADVSMRCL